MREQHWLDTSEGTQCLFLVLRPLTELEHVLIIIQCYL